MEEAGILSSILRMRNGDEQEVEAKTAMLQESRASGRLSGYQIDRYLMGRFVYYQLQLREVDEKQKKLRKIVDRLTAMPWYPATFLRRVDTPGGPRVLVAESGSKRLVAVAAEVEVNSLPVGQEVFLNNERNAVISTSPEKLSTAGELGCFDRSTEDGRLILTSRDEEVVVEAASPLQQEKLVSGDLLRWDRNLSLAYEKIEKSTGAGMFLEEIPNESFEAIGGLDSTIEELKSIILNCFADPADVQAFDLKPKKSILLAGPPGNGKTKLARALASWGGKIFPSGRSYFMHIKPASLHSMWYSKTEENYRELFRTARRAAESTPDTPVIIFMDEIDAIGAQRGESLHRVSDRVLQSLMAELDGLEERGNVLVISATNRSDVLDSALARPGRLGDHIVSVKKPGMEAARDIFFKYLPAHLPYKVPAYPNDPEGARREIVESAVSQIYSPNAGTELAVIKFDDGTQRHVKPSDLVSGALIEKIAGSAKEKAYLRYKETGRKELRVEEMLDAKSEAFTQQASNLSRTNCRSYLDDLPRDRIVKEVKPVERKVKRAYRYIDLSASGILKRAG